MPFARGRAFQLTIRCEETSFNIMVDGTRTSSFKHTVPDLQEIELLEIRGDVTLTCVAA